MGPADDGRRTGTWQRWLALGFLLALLISPPFVQIAKAGELAVLEPWARATIGQGKSGVVYLTIQNRGAAPDRLIGVSTPVAERAQLHTSVMEDGVMKMRRVEAVEVEPQSTVTLGPSGLHVMLMGLKAHLKKGDVFPATLRFEAAGRLEIEIPVRAVGAMDAGGSRDGGEN